jgi:hypothetical protein
VRLVDLDYCRLAPRHSPNGFANHGQKALASNLTLERRGRGKNFTVAFIFRFERKYDVIIVVEPNFVALVGAVRDNGTCYASVRV